MVRKRFQKTTKDMVTHGYQGITCILVSYFNSYSCANPILIIACLYISVFIFSSTTSVIVSLVNYIVLDDAMASLTNGHKTASS